MQRVAVRFQYEIMADKIFKILRQHHHWVNTNKSESYRSICQKAMEVKDSCLKVIEERDLSPRDYLDLFFDLHSKVSCNWENSKDIDFNIAMICLLKIKANITEIPERRQSDYDELLVRSIFLKESEEPEVYMKACEAF
jgi:hypothetical protein